jgi:hypothetical protein
MICPTREMQPRGVLGEEKRGSMGKKQRKMVVEEFANVEG